MRQKDLVAVRIARTSLGLYAADALTRGTRWHIDSRAGLRDLPLLTYTSAFNMLQEAKWFEAVRTATDVVVETNSTHTLLAAALAGVGIAVLPRFVARSHHGLVAVSDDVANHDVLLITHPEFRRDPKVRATADFLKQVASGPDGLG